MFTDYYAHQRWAGPIGLHCDFPLNYAQGFQDPGTNFMYAIIDLHDRIIFFLLIILTIVFWFQISSQTNKDHLSYQHHGNTIELIWTITPAIIQWMIGIPSLKLLYSMDEILDPQITIKAIGNQWYWSYEYTDYEDNILFDSFLTTPDSLELGDIRGLTVDNYLVLPISTSIRILITSNDVIHAFAVPSQGLKCDALPGRLNAQGLTINRPSIYYGQCSELCGFAHGFMPIGIKAVTLPEYLSFLHSANLGPPTKWGGPPMVAPMPPPISH